MGAGTTSRLAERIASTRFDSLSPAAVTVVKQCLLDFIGVTIAGMREPLSRILLADVREAGGAPLASIVLEPGKVNLDQAAISSVHAPERDLTSGLLPPSDRTP